MNKVITINLGGNAYQLEEGGYDALRDYLGTAAARLQDNPDREEILSDIERAIADKFRTLLASYKTVVEAKEVAAVLAEMGPIETDTGESATDGAGASSRQKTADEGRTAGDSCAPRRLFRIHDGAMLAGVCNGLAAYLNIDPTLVRIAFVLLTIFWGAGLLVYVVMALVVPEARSPEEKAAASGFPSTAQEFIRRARAGYYEAMRNFPDRRARREWKRQFKREVRAHADQWRYNWHSYWTGQFPAHPGMGFVLPVLSLFQGAAAVLWISALISLLATGSIFGLALPAGVPVWVAALLLFVVYGVVTGPLKVARRSCYWGRGGPRTVLPSVFFLDLLIWFAVAASLFWLAIRYSPELQDAIQSIPSVLHQAADDIRTWWQQK